MVIVGAKGFAKEVLEVLYQLENLNNLSFYDDVSLDTPTHLYNVYPILRNASEVKSFFQSLNDYSFTLGVGNPKTRYLLFKRMEQLKGQFNSTISPYARIGHYNNVIKEGCNIMTGVVITNDVYIGNGALINLNCTIGHDCVIGEFVEMSPGVHISGNCIIGNFCSIGTNATVLPKLSIGENVVIGAGTVVTKDIPSNSLVIGVPGKVVKQLPALIFED